ncbi:MAG: serine/threonine-protein phosphatase [Bacteroidetes bacterium]|nr:serine/threonine-protein phosphatase [Bacteroidota bacterium]
MSSAAPEPRDTVWSRLKQDWESFTATVRSEWKELTDRLNSSGRWNSALVRESNEVTDFYLTAAQHERLKTMRQFEQVLYKTGWVFRAMFERLRPERRLLALAGIFLQFFNDQNNNNSLIGSLFLVLVIMLELKDKLMAHDELAAGRKIQQSLMPPRMPSVPGWELWLFTRSANEVCGDLIDFIPGTEGRSAVVMADVSGKGLHAALITTKLQATIRALAGEIGSLPVLIARINTIVHRDSPSHIFASLVYAEITEQHGTVRYVNAGHYPALIIRGTGHEECPKGEPALGLARSVPYTEQSIGLQPGDAFVLYSDGLTEAKNAQGDFFGKERLVSLLTASAGNAEQTGNGVLREVERFCGMAAATDDLSLIILRRTGASV